jgi:hypothetical protein
MLRDYQVVLEITIDDEKVAEEYIVTCETEQELFSDMEEILLSFAAEIIEDETYFEPGYLFSLQEYQQLIEDITIIWYPLSPRMKKRYIEIAEQEAEEDDDDLWFYNPDKPYQYGVLEFEREDDNEEEEGW